METTPTPKSGGAPFLGPPKRAMLMLLIVALMQLLHEDERGEMSGKGIVVGILVAIGLLIVLAMLGVFQFLTPTE